MVVLVLLAILLLQGAISYSVAFGRLDRYAPGLRGSPLAEGWLALRVLLLLLIVGLWLFNRKRVLFRAIIMLNGVFTLGLVGNMVALVTVLTGFTAQDVQTLMTGVIFMAVSNILIFSIWYWIIDPPGVEETLRADAPWDFLFPQRAGELPCYENWLPRYTDYLYVAFTTSVAFSPTDTLPLTRRAKVLMLLQATISLVTLTGIAGSAINILAGSR
jgi:hypothetical protein